MAVLMETPNFAYLDDSKPDVNTVALLNKNTLEVLTEYHFEKKESVNCLHTVEIRVSPGSLVTTSSAGVKIVKYILVGTCYMDMEERIPTKGRLLIF